MDKKKRIIAMVGILVVVLGVAGFLYKDDVLGMLGFSSSSEVNAEDDLTLTATAQPTEQPSQEVEQPTAPQEQNNAPQDNTTQNETQPTPSQVNPNLARSCESGKLDDCSGAIEQLLGAKDRVNALRLAVVACEKKDAKSCGLMAKMYDEGDSKVASLSSGYANMACEYGDLESCYALGVKYYRGDGVASDMKKAFALFKKSCDGGKIEGCNNMAVIYNNGANGIKKNIKIAKDMFKKACDSGYKPSCENLAKIK